MRNTGHSQRNDHQVTGGERKRTAGLRIPDDSRDFSENLVFTITNNDSSIPSSLKSLQLKNLNTSAPQRNTHNNSISIKPNDPQLSKNENNSEISEQMSSLNSVPERPGLSSNKVVLRDREKSFHSGMKATYLYEHWPANNRFLLKGRLMMGPRSDFCQYAFTWISILSVSITFFVTSVEFLWVEIDPFMPIMILYLFLSTIFFLVFTTFSDPGIIPKKKVFELIGSAPAHYCQKPEPDSITRNPNQENIKKRRKKFCETCEIYRPLRASHCK